MILLREEAEYGDFFDTMVSKKATREPERRQVFVLLLSSFLTVPKLDFVIKK